MYKIRFIHADIQIFSNCYFIYFPKDFEVCSDNDVECETKKKFVPDPRQYNLTEDFIYVEQEWGSLFYKHLGKQKRLAAKNLCSTLTPHAHLPIPRFYEENEFYKTHFGDEGLWLDISYDANMVIQSVNGHSFIRYVRTFTDMNDGIEQDLTTDEFHRNLATTEEFVEIKHHDWINFTDKDFGYSMDSPILWMGENYVFMTNTGEWEWTNESEDGNEVLDAVCVYNIIPDECSKCPEESFCRYTDSERKKTECVCQKMIEGEHCEINSCSHCQNGGFCSKNHIPPDGTNPGHDEIKCICPYPFHGDYCEGTNLNNNF